MSSLDGPQPDEARPEPAQAETGPTVTTAPPPRAPRRWSRVPSHVGPARMSTIVLAVLFVAIFALYLYVRPNPPATASSPSPTTGQPTHQAPARTITTPPPTRTTTAPTAHTSSPTPPETTTGTPTTTSPAPGTVRAPGRSSGSSSPLPSLPTSGSAPTS